MANDIQVTVPDIGGADGVEVIELHVNVGDSIDVDESIITLESDKASMEIPSNTAGVVASIAVSIGDTLSEGSLILTLEAPTSSTDSTTNQKTAEPTQTKKMTESPIENTPSERSSSDDKLHTIVVPDIGGASDVDVIEVLVCAGDEIKKEQSILTLEGDKATMEIPSPFSGVIGEVLVTVGSTVSEGQAVMTLLTNDGSLEPEDKGSASEKAPLMSPPEIIPAKKNELAPSRDVDATTTVHATPAVRRFSRELGVSLSLVSGSGRKGRIIKEDVQAYIKKRMLEPASNNSSGLSVAKAPVIDFSKFGTIEAKPLNKIKRLTGANLHRSWISVPHVTQFDEADITGLEAFRKSQKAQAEKDGYKLTPLAFITKAVMKTLQAFPQFNSSLDESGESLIMKQYFNIGIAVDTPNGLVVPVIKGVDTKGIADIAKEMGIISQKARKKALTPADMNGGCFTISSLGGIGGTGFTPIVNAPEVAILGLSRSKMAPVYQDGEFVPRLMLPISLSYDHRVIDGAEAARFTQYLSNCLSDIRTLLL